MVDIRQLMAYARSHRCESACSAMENIKGKVSAAVRET